MAINLETQKAELMRERKEVTDELESLGIHNPEIKEDWIATPGETIDAEADDNVAADRVEEWDERRATLSVLEGRFNDIERALANIENGTYGACEVCGAPIGEERLRAYPAARTCIDHADQTSA